MIQQKVIPAKKGNNNIGNDGSCLSNSHKEFVSQFSLFSAYPNPFNPITTINYSVENDSPSTGLNAISQFNIDPESDCQTQGFDRGDNIAYYNYVLI